MQRTALWSWALSFHLYMVTGIELRSSHMYGKYLFLLGLLLTSLFICFFKTRSHKAQIDLELAV